MLFQEALTKLQEGAAMRRKAWPMEEGYLKILPGMKHVWKVVIVPNPNAGNFIFSVEDFLSDDWQEFNSDEFKAANVENVEAQPEAA